MVRIVKEYDERYNEFLDTAQTLFYRKGYEQTSVQEIIRAVGVAKGTFYHYFNSKAKLLDALVERMIAQMLSTLQPMLADETLSAAEKFEQFFAHIGSWKAANRDFLLDVMRVLYQDENILLRIKMQREATAIAAPLLAQIIRQGMDEGIFNMEYPDEAAEILVKMGQALSDALVSLLLAGVFDAEAMHRIERKILAYDRSVERVLGAAEGSLSLFDAETVKIWLPNVGVDNPAELEHR